MDGNRSLFLEAGQLLGAQLCNLASKSEKLSAMG
jgi:hypothetical protein